MVPWQVIFRDLDTFGHVNNAVYFTYFEVARTALWLELTGGKLSTDVGFIVVRASGRAFRRRTKGARSDKSPRWLGRLDRTPWLLVVLVGAFMLTYSLTLAAAAEILKADVSTADALLALAVFALASMTTIAAPIVLVLVAPERAAERLAEWRRWLLGNSRAVGLVALMVIGVLLIARGIHDLVV